MKLGILALLGMVLGTQVCLGAEKEEKKSSLRINVGDQTLTMVPLKGDGVGEKINATPHHTTSKKFFPKFKAVNPVLAQQLADAIPGAMNIEGQVQESVKSRVKLELAKSGNTSHRPKESLEMWMGGLEGDVEDEIIEQSSPVSPKRESAVLINRAVKERTGSVALSKTDDISEDSLKKAEELMRSLDVYRQLQAQRLTMSGKR